MSQSFSKQDEGQAEFAALQINGMGAETQGDARRTEGTEQTFEVKVAHLPQDHEAANLLVERMYNTRGYRSKPLPPAASGHLKTFVAWLDGVAVGTLSVRDDSPMDGLMADALFKPRIDELRAGDKHVCEFTRFAVDRSIRSVRLLPALFHIAFLYAFYRFHANELLIEVNPRHVRYYQDMLKFREEQAPLLLNERVGAPARLLAIDLVYGRGLIDEFGGRPELAATERSVYPHFFSKAETEDIIGKLDQTDEPLVLVPKDVGSVFH